MERQTFFYKKQQMGSALGLFCNTDEVTNHLSE